MHVTRIESFDDPAIGPEAWNRLSGDMPFLRREWLESWWRHYGTRGDLYVLAVNDSTGRLVAVAPWYWRRSPLGGRVLCFLASGEVCSDYLRVPCLPSCEDTAAQAIADWLDGFGADDWDTLDLEGIDPTDATLFRLIDHLDAHGHPVHQSCDARCWRLELPATWDEYLARLSRSRRREARALWRANFDTKRAIVHVVDHVDNLDRGLEILAELHRRRRESLGDRGRFDSPRFRAFHHDAARTLVEQGRARLSWLELEGQPVAADYNLLGGDTIYHYQTGMDPAWRHEQPGWLAVMASLRAAIVGGYRAFDFLRGDEPYKSQWRAHPQPLLRLRVAGLGTEARLRHRAWLAGKSTKRWAKKTRDLWNHRAVPSPADLVGASSA